MTNGPAQFQSAITEAANRAEATALLIRCGFRVYRPEADIEGEDLVLRTPWRGEKPKGELIGVQLKSRPVVDKKRYGGRNLYLLFPSAPFHPSKSREWFLGDHDELYRWVEARHGNAPKWDEHWSYPSISADLRKFLIEECWRVNPIAEGHEDKFGLTHVPADLTNSY